MQQLLTLVRSSLGLRQSLISVVGNVLATGISAVAIIFISRLLGPSEFGQFSVGFALVQILNRLSDLGLNAATIKFAGRETDPHRLTSLVAYAIKLKFLFSLSIVAAGLILVPLLQAWLRLESPAILWLSFIFSLATTWYEQLLSILQAMHRFTQAVATNAIQAISKLAAIIGFLVLGQKGLIPIYTAYVAVPFVSVAASRWLLPKWFKLKLRDVWQSQAPVGFLAMTKHSAIGLTAAGLIENLDVLFVQGFLTSYETGLLSGVSRIAMMITLVAYSLGNVLYPRVTRYQSADHLSKYIRKAVLLVAASFGGFLLFLPFSRLAIVLTIGDAYVAGLPIMIILGASAFLTLATIPFLALFYAYHADWYFSVSGLIQLAIVLVGNIWLVPEFGLEAAAWTKLVTRIFLFLFTAGLSLYIYHRKYSQQTSHETR